jgi:hypothetical protein
MKTFYDVEFILEPDTEFSKKEKLQHLLTSLNQKMIECMFDSAVTRIDSVELIPDKSELNMK